MAFAIIVLAMAFSIVILESPTTLPKNEATSGPVYVLPKAEDMERVANPLQF